MARITIELPEHFVFDTDITLVLMHMNIANHLDNSLLLGLVAEARIRYWKHLGYKAMDIEGITPVVADVAVEYKSQAYHGEVMVVEVAPRDFHKYGFDLVWRISEKESGREVARGKTGLICFDFKTQKVTHTPEKLLAKLKA